MGDASLRTIGQMASLIKGLIWNKGADLAAILWIFRPRKHLLTERNNIFAA
jgi:hypothetical protein